MKVPERTTFLSTLLTKASSCYGKEVDDVSVSKSVTMEAILDSELFRKVTTGLKDPYRDISSKFGYLECRSSVEEIINASANQRPGQQLEFQIASKKIITLVLKNLRKNIGDNGLVASHSVNLENKSRKKIKVYFRGQKFENIKKTSIEIPENEYQAPVIRTN
jgi:hypothetical protein